jgi:hypothetical protein
MAVTANRLLVLKRMLGSFLRFGDLQKQGIQWGQNCVMCSYDWTVIFSDCNARW